MKDNKIAYNKLLDEVKQVVEQFDYDTQRMNRGGGGGYHMVDQTPVKLEQKIQRDLWKDISPDLYLFFWYLKLDKIYIPEQNYKDRMADIKNDIRKL